MEMLFGLMAGFLIAYCVRPIIDICLAHHHWKIADRKLREEAGPNIEDELRALVLNQTVWGTTEEPGGGREPTSWP